MPASPDKDAVAEARKYFFFEKKKQKTFVLLADATDPNAHYAK
jgi:hypothetical protein